jgi:6-phosphogluconolactonase (cycloisomerase 2 family)
MLLRALATLALGMALSACEGGGGGGGGGDAGPFSVGGAVSGLASGASVVLVNNGSNATTVGADGAFTFSTTVTGGSTYAVTIQSQPTNQVCTVANGSGSASANVSNVTVACVTNAANTFTIGGTVSGLASGASVGLRNNGGNDLTISANGAFAFTTAIATGEAYAVTVLTQPTGQTCAVANGSDTIALANVTNVAVTCVTNPTPTFAIGGTVSGLVGPGLVLRNNGGNNLAISADGAFNFTTAIATGSAYAVTVLNQPTGQTCAVANGSGTIASANVANVAVTCVSNPTPTFTIGGTVSGLAGTGLVLHNNGGNNLAISANGSFNFTTAIASGATYAVTVLTQPSSPTQSCVVTNGSGTVASADITDIAVTCTTSRFTVGGTISGLVGTGLVLHNNGGNNLAISANGAFTFTTPIASGATYTVTVLTQPSSPTQACVVTNGSGTVASANLTDVSVTCTTSQFTVGGTVSGLAGTGLVLQYNGGNNLAISANGAFTFSTPITSGATYAVTVLTQPSSPTQSCVVTNGTGTVAGANLTNVTVTCTTSQFTVGGTVSGLAGTGLVLRNNDSNNRAVSANGAFTFTTAIASGATYAVTVLTQPSSPTQTCVVTNGTGAVASANITNITVTCTTSQFTVGGTISGLTASGLNLRNNGGTALAIAAGATSFSFPSTLASGAGYAVTVSQQPSQQQTCAVSNGTGTVANANVTDVSVACGSGSGSGYAFFSNENGTPRVASYSVGANGGFTQVSAVSVGAPATGVAVTPSGNHVIVAVDPSDAVDGELRVYSVGSTGELAFVSGVPMGPGVGGYSHTSGCGARPGNSGDISCGIGINSAPETVVIHPNGRFVYVMDGVAGGACTPAGVAPCVPPAGFPAAGNRVIVRYTFDPATGALTYQDQQYVEGFMSFTMDPLGRFVWGTSYLERRIYEFRINQSTGALTFGTGTFIGMSNGAMSLAIDPNGDYAYGAHEGDRTIDSYTINQTTGRLTNIGSINGDCSAVGANCNKATNVLVRDLVVSADGTTLYGASSGVFAYALGLDGSIGAPLAGSPFAPSTPLNGGGSRSLVGIGSGGQYLYLQGYNDAATRVFSINSSTGALTETVASPTPLAGGTGGTTALSLQ